MPKNTLFCQYIADRQYEKAVELIKEHLRKADVLDPRDDYSYGLELDQLAYPIFFDRGPQAFVDYHRDWLKFFVEEMEPAWGRHLHKGHFYLRMGLGSLAIDVAQAKDNLRKAYGEDRLQAQLVVDTGRAADGEALARTIPPYVTLYILERLERGYFKDEVDRRTFFAGLASLPFEVVMGHNYAPTDMIELALKKLIPAGALPRIQSYYNEMNRMVTLDLVAGIPAMLEVFIKRVLLSILESKPEVKTHLSKPAGQASLEELIRAFDDARIFDRSSIPSSFRMPVIYSQVSLMPPAEYEFVTEAMVENLAIVGIKLLVDKAIADWAGLYLASGKMLWTDTP
jgi:hypothetical protein